MRVTNLFAEFFESERTGGLLLLICTIASLSLANSIFSESYTHLIHTQIGPRSLEFWINDGLMAIFFLLIGLEIEREVYIGELSDIKKSLLPVFAALGGLLLPGLIHYLFNRGTPWQDGFGIPMATDIAFSLAVLSLLGTRVPLTLKVFLTALAIIDDLGAIIIIAIFYSKDFSLLYFGIAAGVFGIMLILNRLRVYLIWAYLVLGVLLWYLMYRTGIHPTIAGVLVAFAIPFGNGDEKSLSYRLQHALHSPVAYVILPLFALVNTAIVVPMDFVKGLVTSNSIGIMLGLLVGKPVGIILFALLGVAFGFCTIPPELTRRHLLWTGFLAGIGFTMSIFITLLAFGDPEIVDSSKIAIILGSFIAGTIGYLGLRASLKPQLAEFDAEL